MFQGGINFSYNIFSGRQQAIKIENARVAVLSSKERYQNAKHEVRKNVLNAYNNYENNLFLLNISEDDVETASLNFQRSKEAYQTGIITSTEFRQSQLNLLRAILRIKELRISAKLSELELYRLAGLIVTEW